MCKKIKIECHFYPFLGLKDSTSLPGPQINMFKNCFPQNSDNNLALQYTFVVLL